MTTEHLFKCDAQKLVDALFDNKLFRPDLTREDMRNVEELISFTMQSQYDLNKRMDALLTKIEKSQNYTHQPLI